MTSVPIGLWNTVDSTWVYARGAKKKIEHAPTPAPAGITGPRRPIDATVSVRRHADGGFRD